MKKWLIAVIVAAVVVVGTVVGVTTYANQPEVVTRNSISDLLNDFTERKEIAPVLKMFKEGSLELGAKVTDTEEGMPEWLSDLEAGGKIYFGEKECMLDNVYIKNSKNEISFSAYAGEDLFYVANDDILDGNWGIIRGETADAFEDWIFAEELSESIKDTIAGVLEAYDDGVDKDFEKDLNKYVEKYTKVIFKSLEKNAVYESEKDDVKVGGTRVSARVITITIDAEAMKAILEDVYEKIEDDDGLRDVILKYAEYFEAAIDVEDIEEAYDEMLEQFEEAVDNFDEDEDGSVDIELVTPKAGSKLLKLTVTAENENGKKEKLLVVDAGEAGVKDSKNISIYFENVEFEYEITEDNSKAFECELTYKYGSGEAVKVFSFEIDKSEDEFKLTMPEAETTVSGTWETKGKTTTIVVDKIRIGEDVTVDYLELTIVISQKDKMPKADKSDVESIFEIDEDTIDAWEESAMKVIEEFGFEGFGAKEEAAPNDPEINWGYNEETPGSINGSDYVVEMPEYQW